jgi:diguanylate cyclase (GGDEF)-like protein
VDTSLLGLGVQTAGNCLVAVVTLLVARSLGRVYAWYWAAGWVSLACATAALLVAQRLEGLWAAFFTLSLFGQYAFGFFLVAGCANYAIGSRLRRRHLVWLIPGGALAAALAVLSRFELRLLLVFHAPILAAFFVIAWREIRPARLVQRRRIGVKVASIALVALAVDFLHYAPVLYLLQVRGSLGGSYLRNHWLYDLVLLTLLGFGVVMTTLEAVAADLARSNSDLSAARDRLEVQARIDPLTELFNRHAFSSFVESQDAGRPIEGCAVVVDVDNLKSVNDSLGHAAGDATIRAAAKAIRSVIRPDDMLFRWGGDEFLVLLFGVSDEEARSRLGGLDRQGCGADGNPIPQVSWGVAHFSSRRSMRAAIELADDDMYAHKRRRRLGAPSHAEVR